MEIQVGNALKVIKVGNLPGHNKAPQLTMGELKEAKEVLTCKCGSKHIDVGLKSKLEFVSCFECKQELPRGSEIHWCHPSRFEIITP